MNVLEIDKLLYDIAVACKLDYEDYQTFIEDVNGGCGDVWLYDLQEDCPDDLYQDLQKFINGQCVIEYGDDPQDPMRVGPVTEYEARDLLEDYKENYNYARIVYL